MSKWFLSLALVGAVCAVACRSTDPTNPGADMSGTTTGDGGSGGGDMTMRNYTDATPNQIDTNAGGAYPKNTAVRLTGVVAISPVAFFKSNSGARCDYEVWVQDPACTTPPCGLVVISKGPAPDANMNCPFPDNAQLNTALKGIEMGDVLTVSGIVDTFVNGPVTQHEVEADTVTKTASGNTSITPRTITDCSPLAMNGAGYTMYEGTLIKCAPLAPGMIANGSNFYVFTFGGAQFSRTFGFNYEPSDGGDGYPFAGSTFASITGVVTNLFGGQILPRVLGDFVTP